MNLINLRRTLSRVLVVSAMTFGLVAVTASVASASPGTWYVSPTGSDTTSCTSSASPCKTIQYALSQATSPGTINVAAGTYVGQVTATPVNDGVTVEGPNSGTSTIKPPTSGLTFDTDTDTPNDQYYVVDVQPGTTGFGLENLSVNGGSGISYLASDGKGCSQNYDAVYYHEASGSITNVSVTGGDIQPACFEEGLGNAIYVNSGSDPVTVSMTNVTVKATASTTTTKTNLTPASFPYTYTDKVIKVASVPTKFKSGQYISIAGNAYITATKVSSTKLSISGTIDYAAPKGSTVNYIPFTGAYGKNGIACNDPNTTCNITDATVQGAGATNAIAQNGILLWGTGSGTVNGGNVSGNTYTGGGGPANSASGIEAVNPGTMNVGTTSAVTLTGNDVDIYAGENSQYTSSSCPGLCPPASAEGTWTIENNVVEDTTSEGLSANEDGFGDGMWIDGVAGPVDVYGNTVTHNLQADVLMTGDQGVLLGGTSAGQANTIEDASAGAGVAIGGPSLQCELTGGYYSYPFTSSSDCNDGNGGTGNPYATTGWASYDNTISGNTVKDNGVGVVVEGANAPTYMGLAPDTDAAYDNTFNGNTWSSNSLANAIDFSGYGGTQIANQFGTADPVSDPSNTPLDSCEPYEGDSANADGILASNPPNSGESVANSTTHNGSTLVTTSISGGFSVFSAGQIVTDTSGLIPNDTTIVSIAVNNDSLVLSNPATGNSGNGADTVSTGSYWAC
jgi:hypothetical protein